MSYFIFKLHTSYVKINFTKEGVIYVSNKKPVHIKTDIITKTKLYAVILIQILFNLCLLILSFRMFNENSIAITDATITQGI